MKTLSIIPFTGHCRLWLLAINFLALLLLTSCSSSDSSVPFIPKNNLEDKVFVLGAQEDDSAVTLVLYVNGTDPDGEPLTVISLQGASLNVRDIDDSTISYTDGDGKLTITEVDDSDNFLSLAFVTDYSNSTKGELDFVANILTKMLDNLPLVYEAQVMTFSDSYEIQQNWTDDLVALKIAVAQPHSDRNKTALYDSMRVALEGDLGTGTIGLFEKCSPAHMLVLFTDGDDNMSSSGYTDTQLASVVNDDKTAVIVLGTSKAKDEVLTTLAGDYGAAVQVTDPLSLEAEVENWSDSLSNIVKLTLEGVVTNGKTLSITVGTQTVDVIPNSHCQP